MITSPPLSMADESASERRALWLAAAPDVVIVAYGLFTVASTLTTVTGTSARLGLGAGSLLLLALGVLAWLPAIRSRWLPAWRADVLEADGLASFEASPRLRAALLLGSAASVALWALLRLPLLSWINAVLFCAALLLATFARRRGDAAATPQPRPPPVPISKWQLRVVLLLTLGCAALTLACVRPRTDDPFYINVAVGIADHPEAPLLAVATAHGPSTDTLPEQPLFAPYRVHSFEALGGYLSYLTGIDAIAVVHLGMATFFAAFAVFALVRLFRVTSQRHWLLALVVTLAYLWIDGSAGRGFANQAFVRLFHGKAVMLTAVVPLILAYGMRFGMRPTRSRFALLALAQISAMGLTSTAIWLAPIVAMLAVVGAVPTLRRMPSAGLLSALSSGYVLAMGSWVRVQMRPDTRRAIAGMVVAVEDLGQSVVEIARRQIGGAMGEVLGGERASIALLLAVALACLVAERAAVCRVLAGLGFVLAAALTNPWLIEVVSSSITGALTYERVFWVLPVPVAFGLGAAGVASLLSTRLGEERAVALAAAAAIGLVALATERLVLSEANGAQLRFPPVLKTSERLRPIGREACELAPAGTTILASEPVSRQLMMLHHCSPPVIAGMRWMHAPLTEERRRTRLQRYVTEKRDVSPQDVDKLIEGLDRYRVSVVVVAPDAMANRPVKAALLEHGFDKATVVGQYHLYVRERRGGAVD